MARERRPSWVARLAVVSTMMSLLVAMLSVTPASAALAAVGPINPDTGFPLYYEDATGMRLQPCLTSFADCFAGATVPNPGQPPSVPGNYPDESFYYAVDSDMTSANNGAAFLRVALEGGFSSDTGAPEAGKQAVFSRFRVRVDNLIPGQSYTIIHPWGTRTLTATVAGKRSINFTEDIGCPVAPGSPPCVFSSALAGTLGNFLGWDPAVAPAAPAGFLGSFATPHPITGSTFTDANGNPQNYFRIEGPDVGGPGVNAIQTNLFTVNAQIAGGVVRPSLLAADDSGASNADRITRINTPRFTGVVTPGATARIYSDGTLVGSATADGAGAYTITASTLADGPHAITATEQAGANPESAPSASLSVTIDTTAPAAPSLTGTDPASPANNNSPKVKGSAEAGSAVRLFTDGACTTAAAAGTAADLGGAGITVTVADNTSTTFFGTATDVAGNPSGCSASSVTYVENSAPTVTAPTTALRKGRSTTAVPVTVRWTGSGTITSYTLERSVNGGAFQPVSLASPTSTSFNDTLTPGSTYQYRASASNGSITGTPQTGAPVQVAIIDHNSPSVAYTGAWSSGTDTRFSSTAGATAKVTFNGGVAVGWVSQKASTRGTADVTVDGAFAETVNLAAGVPSGKTKKNQVVSIQPLTGAGPTHTMTIKVDLNKRVDIDAFVILR